MVNQITPNLIPESVQPVSPSPVKSNKILIIILSVLLVITVIITGFLFLQTQKLSKELSIYLAQTSPIPTQNPTIEDEILALQITACCSCPAKISRSLIGTDGWTIYEKGKDYSDLLPAMCKAPNIGVCAPCPPLEEENPGKINCTNPRPEVCTMECAEPPPYLCGSDGKSYCSACQACSKKNILWYETQDSPCGEN